MRLSEPAEGGDESGVESVGSFQAVECVQNLQPGRVATESGPRRERGSGDFLDRRPQETFDRTVGGASPSFALRAFMGSRARALRLQDPGTVPGG